MALFVPDEAPLQFYEALIQTGLNALTERGCMVAECHRDFSRQVAECWQLEDARVDVLRDLQGAERAVRLRRH